KGLHPNGGFAEPSATPSGLESSTAFHPGEPRTATLGNWTQPLRGWESLASLPRVAADGNPGLWGATPSGLKLNTHPSALSTHHSALPIHHSALSTHHSALPIHHSALSTQHSALPIHHSALVPRPQRLETSLVRRIVRPTPSFRR